MKADQILKAGIDAMKDRAASRDQPNGERSMGLATTTFNQLTGHCLSETDGWVFMTILKMARAQQGGLNLDDYVDGAAYMALAGESESITRVED